MPSSTITVRFDDELYHKIKNHEINTSDLVRTSVRRFLKELEEDNDLYNKHLYDEIQPIKQINQPVLQRETPVYTGFFDNFDSSFMKKNNQKNVSSEDLTPLVNELTEKIDELDDEIDTLIKKIYENKRKK